MKTLVELFNTCTNISQEVLDDNTQSELVSLLSECNDQDVTADILDACYLPVHEVITYV